jgi:hypothetical protein
MVRALSPAEYPRLRETGADLAQLQQAAAAGVVLVAERDDRILGCAMVVLCAHLEGCWVHPEVRGTRVTAQLWRAVKEAIALTGAHGVVGCAVTPTSDQLIRRLGGVVLDGHHYVIPLEAR